MLALAPLAACAKSQPARLEVVDLPALVARVASERPGEPMLVNYWATWCPPCVAELPELVEVARAHPDAEVLAVSLDLVMPSNPAIRSAADVGAFAEERDFDLAILALAGTTAEEAVARLGLPGPIPYTVAIDRHGKVVDTQEGMASRERFEEMLAAAQR
jgi:thiol-disulfide isomerase/thioredoxin